MKDENGNANMELVRLVVLPIYTLDTRGGSRPWTRSNSCRQVKVIGALEFIALLVTLSSSIFLFSSKLNFKTTTNPRVCWWSPPPFAIRASGSITFRVYNVRHKQVGRFDFFGLAIYFKLLHDGAAYIYVVYPTVVYSRAFWTWVSTVVDLLIYSRALLFLVCIWLTGDWLKFSFFFLPFSFYSLKMATLALAKT